MVKPCGEIRNASRALARPVETGLRTTWLGHSTVLVEIDGARVLTDPVWSERASPVAFAGPKRFQPVPVPISALPAVDAVVLSHDHHDHLARHETQQVSRRRAQRRANAKLAAALRHSV